MLMGVPSVLISLIFSPHMHLRMQAAPSPVTLVVVKGENTSVDVKKLPKKVGGWVWMGGKQRRGMLWLRGESTDIRRRLVAAQDASQPASCFSPLNCAARPRALWPPADRCAEGPGHPPVHRLRLRE